MRFLIYVFTMVLFSGCALLTDNSIDEGSYANTSWLGGKWYMVKTGKPERYEVEPVKNKPGQLTIYPLDSQGRRQKERLSVILSEINGSIFMNAFWPPDSSKARGWYIYKFDKISDKEFRITELRERLVNSDISSKDLKAFLTRNKDHADIYNDTQIDTYKKME